MPYYDYKCPKCFSQEEVFHRMEEAFVKSCDTCGDLMEKQVSLGVSAVFKGSGFYETDYKNNKNCS
jgi:putative FmdB family regulatory protein